MPRPQCCRQIAHAPTCAVFMPAGVPACDLKEVVLFLDEYEAIRLADLEGLYQDQAAGRMNVSRQTFGRILEAARKKVAQVLMEGNLLRIEGGQVKMCKGRTFKCHDCQRPWTLSTGDGTPKGCPNCKSMNFRRENGVCPKTGARQDEAGQVRNRCCQRRSQSK